MWFDRRDTDWKINLLTFDEDGSRPEDLFDGFYRTVHREGRECAQFTIMPKNSSLCIVQIRIFPDGEITIESHPSVLSASCGTRSRSRSLAPNGKKQMKKSIFEEDRRMHQQNDPYALQESLALLFDADAVDRRDWLERITPAELEWYYANGYIQ